MIHQLDEAFGFDEILLDPAGDGLFVQRKLKSPQQFMNGADQGVTPIVDLVNGPTEVTRGYIILQFSQQCAAFVFATDTPAQIAAKPGSQ